MSERLAALGAGKFLEFSMNKVPKCPHCGADFDIDRNEAWRIYDENDRHEVDCPVCNEDFTIRSHADWRFSTDEQDEE
jgi:uncharacterized Zn-finger protein